MHSPCKRHVRRTSFNRLRALQTLHSTAAGMQGVGTVCRQRTMNLLKTKQSIMHLHTRHAQSRHGTTMVRSGPRAKWATALQHGHSHLAMLCSQQWHFKGSPRQSQDGLFVNVCAQHGQHGERVQRVDNFLLVAPIRHQLGMDQTEQLCHSLSTQPRSCIGQAKKGI
jgi:hypothetical protein